MNLGISFAPLVPSYVVWAAFAVAVLISMLLLFARSRGAALRALALGLMVLALANPSLAAGGPRPDSFCCGHHRRQEPEPELRRSHAANRGCTRRPDRTAQAYPGTGSARREAGAADGETDGTKLFPALSSTLADVPPDRLAGAIMITDGHVHDVPADAAALGFAAPLHALITGRKNEIDRRVVLTRAPLRHRRADRRPSASASKIKASGPRRRRSHHSARRRDSARTVHVSVHTDIKFKVPIPHAGPNIVEIEADAARGELTTSTTAPSSRSRACARSCACCWSRASRMPASAPGATC